MPSYYEQMPTVGENAKRNLILEAVKPCFLQLHRVNDCQTEQTRFSDICLPGDDRDPLRNSRHQVLQLGVSFCSEGRWLSSGRAFPPQGHQVLGCLVRLHLGCAACRHLHHHLRHICVAGKPADCSKGLEESSFCFQLLVLLFWRLMKVRRRQTAL